MSKEKAVGLLRALDVVLVSLAIALSILVLVYPQPAVLTLIFTLSIALLVVGIAEMLAGMLAKYLSGGLRALRVGAGLLVLWVASMALGYPPVSIRVLINLLSFGQLINGITGAAIGSFAKTLTKRLRILLVLGGLLTIIVSIFIFVHPTLGSLALVYLLAISFLLNGVAKFALTIKGTQRVET
jgi:uncharacterized membrane protein HdeD (DUF308 family)